MISSHYAEPVDRIVAGATPLHADPSNSSRVEGELAAGEPFSMLDDTLGWAWGYAGKERRVGYVPSEALRRRSS